MTTTDPERFRDALEASIRTWATATGQTPPAALFCAEPHPLDESTLCRRLDGHSGLHAADGDDVWGSTATVTSETETHP